MFIQQQMSFMSHLCQLCQKVKLGEKIYHHIPRGRMFDEEDMKYETNFEIVCHECESRYLRLRKKTFGPLFAITEAKNA